MKSLLTIILLFTCIFLYAQTENFDIATYLPPAGWKKQVTDYAVSFSSIDNISGAWCQLAIYKSIPASGVAATDFSNEWKALVKPATYSGSQEPQPVTYVADGWTHSSGISKFLWQGKDAQVSVFNISGYGTMVSALVSMNSTKYAVEVDKLLKSIELKKPQQSNPPSQSVQQSQSVSSTSSGGAIVKVTEERGLQGIVIATTNFDDGWVAQPFADYVKVVKQPVTVLLHYAIAVDDEMRAASNMAVLMWNRLVASRYRAANLRALENEMYTYNKIWFVEAEATEIATGKNYHVGLRVLVANGIASCIEISAPSAAAFQQEFPNQTKVEAMVNYNKFAVSAQDLIGTWEESSSSSLNYYNTVTGGYAGTNTSASANSFTIRSNGTYESEHKGAYGMTESMTFYDQKYNGKYTLTPWDITMTNRFKERTDVFFCQYEAVRGGRVLQLRDKAYATTNYRLVKVK